jgi:uncharacterized protein YkwD
LREIDGARDKRGERPFRPDNFPPGAQSTARMHRDRALRVRPDRSSLLSMRPLQILFSLVAATTLTACGGGGGSSSTLVVPAPGPAPAADGTLQTSVPTPAYTDARRLAAFNQLNAVRLGAGAGLLAQSTALDTIAANHVAYLNANGFSSSDSAHDETSGLTGYTGATPFTRMTAAGYQYSYATEVIGDIGSTSATSDCVGDLLDTVYHAASMLSRVVDVGFAFGSGSTAGMCTIDMASPLTGGAARQIPASGAIIAYPYDGSTVAHGTFQVSSESPRVSTTLLPDATAGTPIVVGLRNQDLVASSSAVATITEFALYKSDGTALPGVILADPVVKGSGVTVHSDSGLDSAFAVFVPTSPLAAGTYTVVLQASISGGQALALSHWTFTVAAL